MRTALLMLCRTVGQLGIVTSAAATLASYSTLLPGLGEFYIPPSLLTNDLLDLLPVPISLFVLWASWHQRRRQPALAGCGVLATLVVTRLAVLQSWTGLYSLWGAAFVLSTAVFELGSIGLLAASYHRGSGAESGGIDDRARRVGLSWIWGIMFPLLGLSTLCAWSGLLPSIFVATVATAGVLYAVQRWLRPAVISVPSVPVTTLLLGLAALRYGLYVALVAVGPTPVVSATEVITTVTTAIAALSLAAVWLIRAHRTRAVASHERTPHQAPVRCER
jgi:hypothetical protein